MTRALFIELASFLNYKTKFSWLDFGTEGALNLLLINPMHRLKLITFDSCSPVNYLYYMEFVISVFLFHYFSSLFTVCIILQFVLNDERTIEANVWRHTFLVNCTGLAFNLKLAYKYFCKNRSKFSSSCWALQCLKWQCVFHVTLIYRRKTTPNINNRDIRGWNNWLV